MNKEGESTEEVEVALCIQSLVVGFREVESGVQVLVS